MYVDWQVGDLSISHMVTCSMRQNVSAPSITAFTKYKSDDLTQFVFATEAVLFGPKCAASLNKHAT